MNDIIPFEVFDVNNKSFHSQGEDDDMNGNRKWLNRVRQALKDVNTFNPDDNNIEVRRSNNPMNEFMENSKTLAGAFPFIFSLGLVPKHDKKALPIKMCRHILLQFTRVPAQCKELIYFLANQILRHEKLCAVKLALKSSANKKMIDKFNEFLNKKMLICY